MNRAEGQRPGSRSILSALIIALGLSMALAGCLQTATLPEPGVTPMEPPPLPPRRPAPPAGFAIQQPNFAGPEPVFAVQQPNAPVQQPPAAVQQEAVTGQQSTDLPIPGGLYRVQPGDTVYGIARRAGLPLRPLIDANRLAPPYRLAVGRDLIIPRARVHVVKAGETVYRISQIHGVDRSQLTRINGIGPPFEIRVGQRLVLPEPGLRTELATLPDASASGASLQQAPPQQQPAPPRQNPAQEAAAPPSQPATVPEAASGQPPLPPRRPSATPQRAANSPTSPAPAPAAQTPRQTQTAAIPQPPPRAGGRFGWPLRGRILSRYGPEEGGHHNDGINIAAPRGAPIQAAENGVVAYVGSELRGYGQLVLIKHADGWVTAYAHADSVLVRLGDTVQRGQAIARVGSTGAVDQPQLHFEIRKGTNAIDPLQMLDGAA
ncbi:peptidoglycan DD-metalloendopeptidase family protein [Algihabitans sp.]|uniref:peptidoglycan DD-metalloendopeptidase family protein n=1 Tax=Algihabitans sp. TaxID=2821514 RepID=UPI003BA93551